MSNSIEASATRPMRHPRIDVADVLRGFAVMAIILLHSIEHFNFYSFPETAGQSPWLNFTDRAIWDGLFFAFGGKAYAIFALLFGFSFFIQHDNQRMRGRDFCGRFAWRLLMLLLIGQLNAAFFTAEILVLYGLVGFILIPVCRWSTKALIVLAAILVAQPVCIYQVINAIANPEYITPQIDTASYWAATFKVQSTGSFLETVKVNLWEGQLASLAWAWDHGRVFQTAGLFITGMLIGRQGWFLERNLGRWGRVLAIAACCFFPLYGLNNMVPGFITNANILTPLRIILSSLSNLAFMLMIISGLLFAYYRTNGLSRLLDRLRPYGRMSMTNYVTQGIIGSALFYHWGLYLRLGITASVFVGVAIFIVQMIACRIWVRHHSHGPLEYLWKRATWIEWPFRH